MNSYLKVNTINLHCRDRSDRSCCQLQSFSESVIVERMNMQRWCNDNDRGKPKSREKKTLSQCNFVSTNPTPIGLVSKPVLCTDRPAT